MNKVIDKINENECLNQIGKLLLDGKCEKLNLNGLTDSAKALIAYALTTASSKNGFIVCSNVISANKMIQDLKLLANDIEIIYLPARKLEYYDFEVESMEIKNARMYAIEKILSGDKNIVVTTTDGILTKMYPSSAYAGMDLNLSLNDTIDTKDIAEKLINLGYESTSLVEGKGQFSIRGDIIDIFAINDTVPYRIELFGNEIDSIRTFDVLTQRSLDRVNSIEISFLSEAKISDAKKEMVISRLQEFANGDNISNELKENILEDIEKIKENLLENIFDKYFELLVEEKSCIIDYLKDYNIFIDEPERNKQKAENVVYENDETLKILTERNYLYIPFANRYYSYEEVLEKILKKNNIYLENIGEVKKSTKRKEVKFDFTDANFYRNSIDVLLQDIKNAKEKLKLLIFSTDTRVEQVKNYLIDNKVKVKVIQNIFSEDYNKDTVYISKSLLSNGFSSDMLNLLVISEPVSGVSKSGKINKQKKQIGQNINSFSDLEVGDYIVHENHGIGIYRGIETISVNEIKKDYIKLEYDNKGILYVPIANLDSVKKYVCDDEAKPKINSLNSKDWIKTKNNVKKHVESIAKDLVLLYAEREKSTGYSFPKDTPWQKEFEDSFPYELTSDQKQAVSEIKDDMESSKTMDRLLCGDVGYGKTEVAIRAAFKAAVSSKQVAYLVPTTVLSLQQYNTFKSRMQEFGINVEMLSRFKTKKQQDQILKDIKDGKIDVVVGTHRLLSKDVEFKDLGLLIIDEEHRFGVKAKEEIKKLKKNVDVLSMTATPIPRTLHMSMVGIRQMSTLSEPPLERLPVHTYVLEYNLDVVKEAIEKELLRDGQVIYLNNRVNDIEEIATKVRNLVPDVRVLVAHGRMEPRQIEDVMIKFMNHKADVLVCTTILESGIDIQNANTLIVENADKLGLAQLYQIRGRVGRSNRLAYAYITYKKDKSLSEVSEKRLKAIRDFTEFGSGFKIALRDLEIRGAGNLFGKEQHGHMIKVGYEMYLSLLEKAIDTQKNKELGGIHGKKTDMTNEILENSEVRIELNVSAYISDSYISDPIQKISMYQKISDIKTKEDSMNLIDELLDRYGDIPKETDNLIKIVEIRNAARKIGMTKISVKGDFLVFEPSNLKFRLTKFSSSDILIRVQLELTKIQKMLDEKG